MADKKIDRNFPAIDALRDHLPVELVGIEHEIAIVDAGCTLRINMSCTAPIFHGAGRTHEATYIGSRMPATIDLRMGEIGISAAARTQRCFESDHPRDKIWALRSQR